MTRPDYPLPVLPSQEMYQVAQIALYIADSLTRHRTAQRGAITKWAARRDMTGGQLAYDRVLRPKQKTPVDDLPRPIDVASYQEARKIATEGPREAHVVSLAQMGQTGWAVVGQVPGIGPVGAVVGSRTVADAIHTHILTGKVEDLAPWAVTEQPIPVPKPDPKFDLATFTQHLDPTQERARAVAAALRGVSTGVDSVIQDRFRGVDLDAPFVSAAPAAPSARVPAPHASPPGTSTPKVSSSVTSTRASSSASASATTAASDASSAPGKSSGTPPAAAPGRAASEAARPADKSVRKSASPPRRQQLSVPGHRSTTSLGGPTPR